MKAKLIKDNDGYWLDISDDGITKRPLTDFGQLSIKNCEAIANGYDLDKLADEYYKRLELVPHKGNAYISGFQKALEILGDKKYNEYVKFMFQFGFNLDNPMSRNEYDAHIQSLQQTEWDVEIDVLMTEREGGVVIETPKLDADGCLILKRI